MKYRKKPVIIEARQFTTDVDGAVESWCGGYINSDVDGVPVLVIDTLEGLMTARIGDWIIKGVAGEFYPCKPDIFKATYEPV